MHKYIYQNTHTHIYIYIYIYTILALKERTKRGDRRITVNTYKRVIRENRLCSAVVVLSRYT